MQIQHSSDGGKAPDRIYIENCSIFERRVDEDHFSIIQSAEEMEELLVEEIIGGGGVTVLPKYPSLAD